MSVECSNPLKRLPPQALNGASPYTYTSRNSNLLHALYVLVYVAVYDCSLYAPPPGTIGHVAHGKSTVVKAISGVQVSEVHW